MGVRTTIYILKILEFMTLLLARMHIAVTYKHYPDHLLPPLITQKATSKTS